MIDTIIDDWRKLLATVPNLDMFRRAARDLGKQVAEGRREKPKVVDDLVSIARAHKHFGFDDEHDVEAVIAEGLSLGERDHEDEVDRERLYAEADEKAARTRKGNGASKPPIRFKLTPFEQIQINTAPNYVLKGIIPRGGLVIFWGPPKCGKSFLCFDIAMHIALGRDYRGRRVQQGSVVYLALEGGGGFADRVEAWRRRHLDGDRAPPFFLLDVAVDIVADHAALIADIRAQTTNPPTVVFLDTLNRGLNGDENNPKDMAAFVRAADAIRRAFGCAVVVIHHCGIAGSRPRGHTSLSGADDAQIAVERDKDGLIVATVEHMKDGLPGLPFACRLEAVDLGLDDEGASMTSCVIVPAELPKAQAGASIRMTGNQARFLDILADAVLDAPAEHKAMSGIPGGRIAISREWLKMCCKSKGWFDPKATENNNRAKVSNMVNALAGKHLLGANALHVWDAR